MHGKAQPSRNIRADTLIAEDVYYQEVSILFVTVYQEALYEPTRIGPPGAQHSYIHPPACFFLSLPAPLSFSLSLFFRLCFLGIIWSELQRGSFHCRRDRITTITRLWLFSAVHSCIFLRLPL
jgi:hypothetical protein